MLTALIISVVYNPLQKQPLVSPGTETKQQDRKVYYVRYVKDMSTVPPFLVTLFRSLCSLF